MQVRYLVIDPRGCVHEAPRGLIEAAWDQADSWDSSTPEEPWGCSYRPLDEDLLPLTGDHVLRLLTAIIDQRGRPARLYYLCAPLNARAQVRRRKVLLHRPAVEPYGLLRTFPAWAAAERMLCIWPANLLFQVAAVLERPAWEVWGWRIGFGGPLAFAAEARLFVEEAFTELRVRLRAEGKEV